MRNVLWISALIAISLQSPAYANQQRSSFVASNLEKLGITIDISTLSEDKIAALEVTFRTNTHEMRSTLKQKATVIIDGNRASGVSPQVRNTVEKNLTQLGFDLDKIELSSSQYVFLHNANTGGMSDQELLRAVVGFQIEPSAKFSDSQVRDVVVRTLADKGYVVDDAQLTDAVVGELYRYIVYVDLSTGVGRFERILRGLDNRHGLRAQ